MPPPRLLISRANRLAEVIVTRATTGVDQASTSGVAVQNLISGQVDGVIRSEFRIDPIIEFPVGRVSCVQRRIQLFAQVAFV